MIKESKLVERFRDMNLNVQLGNNLISYSELTIAIDFLTQIRVDSNSTVQWNWWEQIRPNILRLVWIRY